MTCTHTLRAAIVLTLAGGLSFAGCRQPAADAAAPSVPILEVDPKWPTMPDKMMLAQVAGIAVDSHDHIWVLNRPQVFTAGELRASTNPPIAECCIRNPTIMEFDADGKYIQ